MDSVKVLIQGYAFKEPSGRYQATSATLLVLSEGKTVLIDPGLKPKALKAALDKNNLTINDIDIVLITHNHMDHSRNSKLFDKAKVIDLFSQYKKMPDDLIVPGTQIKAFYTPGHVIKHVAFLVDTAEGKCGIAGDVFWWEDTEEQKTDTQSLIEHDDPLVQNMTLLRESRKKLLRVADYIIPGHGKTFRTSH